VVVVLLLGVEKERDDVDANNALGSDGRDLLSATFIVLVLVFVFWCVMSVYLF